MLVGFLKGLVFGFAGTAHCVGMCGGFPLHLSRASKRSSLVAHQGLYVAGKTFTYAFLGAVSAAIGSTLAASGLLPNTQKTMSVVAGAVIVLFGLGMLGVKLPLPLAGKVNAYEWGFLKSVYAHFFANPGAGSSFFLGMATGFLPCPMTLAMLAVAATSPSVLAGIAVMAGLGAGTAPGLLGVGLGGHLVTARWRRFGLRPAGVIVLLLGTMTILRAQDFMHRGCHEHAPAETSATVPACAHCQQLGHTCPHCAAKAKEAKPAFTCAHCQQLGHTCPHCAAAKAKEEGARP